MRHLLVLPLTVVLAACGGAKKDTGNAAAAASFTYGSPGTASLTQAAALQGPVTGAAAFAGAPSADQGLAAFDIAALTGALLGSSGYGVGVATASPSASALGAGRAPRALVASGFDNPACVATTATGVTLTGCTITVDEVSGGSTFHVVVSASGSMQYAAASRTLGWDLTIGESLTVTGATTGSANVAVHLSGTLTVTETTIAGHMASELDLTASSGGQSMAVGLDESVDLDVTYADAATCATRVTGGTVEAKRVWTARPQGYGPAELPDAAVKVTWTGCGTATVQLGTR